MSVQDEISAILGRSGSEEKEEEVVDSTPMESMSDTAAEEVQEPGESGVEEASTESEEDESLDSRYSKLLEAYNQVSSELQERQKIGVDAPAEPPIVAVTPTTPVDFTLDEKLLEKALIEDDPAAMKQVLMSIVSSLTSQKESWRESVLRDIPTVTRDVARQQIVLMRAVDKFYQDNGDLIPYQGVVGNVTNQISAAHPEYSLGQLFEEVEKNVRKTLGLKKQAKRREETQTPAFVKSASSRKPGPPKIEGIRGEIAAMKAARY